MTPHEERISFESRLHRREIADRVVVLGLMAACGIVSALGIIDERGDAPFQAGQPGISIPDQSAQQP